MSRQIISHAELRKRRRERLEEDRRDLIELERRVRNSDGHSATRFAEIAQMGEEIDQITLTEGVNNAIRGATR